MTYNCHFLPCLSQVLNPLYQLVKREAGWKWGMEQIGAFETAKELVAKTPVLALYDVDKPIRLYCDASPKGVGAGLMYIIDGQERPVAYASWTLAPTALNYAQIEREALAIVLAVRKFYQYLYGRQFTLTTDHHPLCKLLGSNQGVPSLAAARMQRWALILSAYQYVLKYTPGSQNEFANCMSRPPLPSGQHDAAEHMCSIHPMDLDSLPVTAKEIARATLKDTLLAGVLQSLTWPVEKHSFTSIYMIPFTDSIWNLAVKMVLYCGDNEW